MNSDGGSIGPLAPSPQPSPPMGRGSRTAARVRTAYALPTPSPPWGRRPGRGGSSAPRATPLASVSRSPPHPNPLPRWGEGVEQPHAFVRHTRFRLLLPLGGEGRDEGVALHQERRLLQA